MNNPRFWHNNRGNRHRGGHFRGRGGRGNRMNGQFSGIRPDFYNPSQNFGNNFQHKPKVHRDVPTKRLSEQDIGVTEYINDDEGFNGIIKSRYSDFQVAEINLQGEIAKLTNLEPPVLPKDKDIDEDEDLVLNKYNLEILPMETWDNINKLAVAKKCTDKVEIDVTGMTKAQRTKIHDAVKRAFGKGIIGSTLTVDDKKYVTFEKYRKGVRVDRRVKWPWPGEYTYFIVHKENCDTMEAASRIADKLRLNLKPSSLGYAGTKDRRAVTSQWFSARRVEPARVAAACRDLRAVTVGNYGFGHVNLCLGMLQGNMFRITLRNVTASDECIGAACARLQRDGFINYYGLQRFGSRIDTPTYQVGLKLFQGNLKEAVDLIVAAPPGGARPARGSPEHRVLQSLALDPGDLARAIGQIPRNVRLLYIHSYQSLVWNRAASERVRRLGLRAAAGDLVALAPLDRHEDCGEEDSDTDTPDADTETDGNKDSDTAADKKDNTESSTDDKNPKKKKEEQKEILIKVLTQEDIDSGEYSICDVVLPLPGFSVTYPPNMVDYYKELLEKDGLPLDMKNKIRQFSMSGAYRPLVTVPGGVRWRCVRYSDPRADLQLTDRQLMDGLAPPPDLPDGKYKALLLTFTLPTSCYATMALRELLKVDTSCDNQAAQNNYHEVQAAPGPEPGATAGDAAEPASDEPGSGPGNDSAGDKRKLEMENEVDAKKMKQADEN